MEAPRDLRPHQEEAFGMFQEAYNSNDPGRVLLDWKTAAGKSFFIPMCVEWLFRQNCRVVVVTSNVDLRESLFEKIRSRINDKEMVKRVCEVGSGAAACKIPIKDCLVIVSCLKSYKQKNSRVKLSPETVLFVDEAHEFDFYNDRYEEIKELPLICFCSGTPRYDRLPPQSAEKGKLLVHSYSYKQGLDDGYLKHLRLHRSGVNCALDLGGHIVRRLKEERSKRVLVICPVVNDEQNYRSCLTVTNEIKKRLDSMGDGAVVHHVDGTMKPQKKEERREWISEPIEKAPDPRILVICRTFSQGTDMIPLDHLVYLCDREHIDAHQSIGRGLRYDSQYCHTDKCLVEIMVSGGGYCIEKVVLRHMASVNEINKQTVTYDENDTLDEDIQRLEANLTQAEAYVAKLPSLKALEKEKSTQREEDKRLRLKEWKEFEGYKRSNFIKDESVYRCAVIKCLMKQTEEGGGKAKGSMVYCYRARMREIANENHSRKDLENMIWYGGMQEIMMEGGYDPKGKKDGIPYNFPIQGHAHWNKNADNGDVAFFYKESGGLKLTSAQIDAIITYHDPLTVAEKEYIETHKKFRKKHKEMQQKWTKRKKEMNETDKKMKKINAEIEMDKVEVDKSSSVQPKRISGWKTKLSDEYEDKCAIKGTTEATIGCHIIEENQCGELNGKIDGIRMADFINNDINFVGNGIILDSSIHGILDKKKIIIRPENGEIWMQNKDTLNEVTLKTIRSHLSPNGEAPRVKLSDQQKKCFEIRNRLHCNMFEGKKREFFEAVLKGESVKGGYVRIENE